jgi:hypothetical protein
VDFDSAAAELKFIDRGGEGMNLKLNTSVSGQPGSSRITRITLDTSFYFILFYFNWKEVSNYEK